MGCSKVVELKSIQRKCASNLQRNLRSKCKCLQDPVEIEEEELKSLDGDEVMKSSTVSVKGL